mgnify:CR=1 FL=1
MCRFEHTGEATRMTGGRAQRLVIESVAAYLAASAPSRLMMRMLRSGNSQSSMNSHRWSNPSSRASGIAELTSIRALMQGVHDQR